MRLDGVCFVASADRYHLARSLTQRLWRELDNSVSFAKIEDLDLICMVVPEAVAKDALRQQQTAVGGLGGQEGRAVRGQPGRVVPA